MKLQRLLVVLGLVSVALLSRFLPHPPNLTAINSIALFGASAFGNIWTASFTLFVSLFISDLFLGLHTTLPFTYLSFGLVIVLGRIFKSYLLSDEGGTFSAKVACSMAASLIFFIITNFGVWIVTSFYPASWEGLLCCYTAALPFLQNQLLGDLLYTLTIFGLYQSVVKNYRELPDLPIID